MSQPSVSRNNVCSPSGKHGHYCLSRVRHSDITQQRASVRACMQNSADSTFLLCYVMLCGGWFSRFSKEACQHHPPQFLGKVSEWVGIREKMAQKSMVFRWLLYFHSNKTKTLWLNCRRWLQTLAHLRLKEQFLKDSLMKAYREILVDENISTA